MKIDYHRTWRYFGIIILIKIQRARPFRLKRKILTLIQIAYILSYGFQWLETLVYPEIYYWVWHGCMQEVPNRNTG